MTTISNILDRRSVRAFTRQEVSDNDILKMLDAANWAPSGNNAQPWKFVVIKEDKRLLDELAHQTKYYKWVKTSSCLIVVFLDRTTINDNISNCYMKHVQAIGAAIQNILLTAQQLGIGTCWIGEILKNESRVKELLSITADVELMAVIAVGYPSDREFKSKRTDLKEKIIQWL